MTGLPCGNEDCGKRVLEQAQLERDAAGQATATHLGPQPGALSSHNWRWLGATNTIDLTDPTQRAIRGLLSPRRLLRLAPNTTAPFATWVGIDFKLLGSGGNAR